MTLQAMQLEMDGAPDFDAASEDTIPTHFAAEDLRELIGDQDLARLVEQAVSRVNGYLDATDHTRSWEVLLGLLTYFYAIGAYCSDDIEAALDNYATGGFVHRTAFQFDEPVAVLRSFRHANRAALEHCLCHVVQNVYPRASGIEVELEAARRVVNAIEADTWALDA
jgi:hypothetical protein